MKKIVKITTISILSLIIILVLFISLGIVIPNYGPQMQQIFYEPDHPDYWPTQEWQIATPEEQGMDSAKLLEMVEFYEEQRVKNEKISIDSITIVRNSYASVKIWHEVKN